MEKKFNLKEKDLLDKVFLPSYKGYDPNEVDSFLDLIIKDYKIYNEELTRLQNDNLSLREEIINLKNELKYNKIYLNSKNDKFKEVSSKEGVDNLELLKRIDIYEQKLYKLGIDPSKLK